MSQTDFSDPLTFQTSSNGRLKLSIIQWNKISTDWHTMLYSCAMFPDYSFFIQLHHMADIVGFSWKSSTTIGCRVHTRLLILVAPVDKRLNFPWAPLPWVTKILASVCLFWQQVKERHFFILGSIWDAYQWGNVSICGYLRSIIIIWWWGSNVNFI